MQTAPPCWRDINPEAVARTVSVGAPPANFADPRALRGEKCAENA
jgi:hypothetical protein